MFLASQHVLFTLLMGYLNSFIPSLTDLEKNRIQRPRLDNVLYLCVRVELSRIQLFATPWSVAGQAPLSMEFSRQDTGVGCYGLLQGIFPIQGSNPGLSHGRRILYHLSHSVRLDLPLKRQPLRFANSPRVCTCISLLSSVPLHSLSAFRPWSI